MFVVAARKISLLIPPLVDRYVGMNIARLQYLVMLFSPDQLSAPFYAIHQCWNDAFIHDTLIIFLHIYRGEMQD
jgi:hypothetical protein